MGWDIKTKLSQRFEVKYFAETLMIIAFAIVSFFSCNMFSIPGNL